MAEEYRDALSAGVIPAWLTLPGGIAGRQRIVRISLERIRHIAERRPDWLLFCLHHMDRVLADPQYIGYRPHADPEQVEFVRSVKPEAPHLLVAVKFLDLEIESWITTGHPLGESRLTRRLRSGTMREVSRGP